MPVAQSGILALGTSSHAYLELDRVGGVTDAGLVAAAAELAATVKTTGATGLVVGPAPRAVGRGRAGRGAGRCPRLRPSRWSGIEGFTMPATQHDAWLWVAGRRARVVFDATSRR